MLTIFFSVGCEDNLVNPEYGTISGVIDFSGTWPETGNISISLNISWPEVTGAPYAFKTIYVSDLSQDSLYYYSFENVTFGTYQGIIVSWKDPIDTSVETNQHAIGGFSATVDTEFEDANSITVSVSNHELTNLDFSADLDLIVETIPAESGTLSGKVIFIGTWPEEGDVFISLHTNWPETGEPYAYMSISSDDLNQDNEYSYSFEYVIFRRYAAISVLWSNNGWHILGAYGGEKTLEFLDAESVTVTEIDFELIGLNFTAVFGD